MDVKEIKEKLKNICSSVDQATTMEAFYDIIFKFVAYLKDQGIEKDIFCCVENSEFFGMVFETKNKNGTYDTMISKEYIKNEAHLIRILREPERKKNIVRIKKLYIKSIETLNEISKNRS